MSPVQALGTSRTRHADFELERGLVAGSRRVSADARRRASTSADVCRFSASGRTGLSVVVYLLQVSLMLANGR